MFRFRSRFDGKFSSTDRIIMNGEGGLGVDNCLVPHIPILQVIARHCRRVN
jgi:hypothetical protein